MDYIFKSIMMTLVLALVPFMGISAKKEYKKVIDRAWTYLTETAIQSDGKVGYVQPIGERAIPGQTVDANSQANFGVGAVLLTACEYDKYLANK